MIENAEKYTRRLIKEGAYAKKSLGQNFLIDDRVIEAIVNSVDSKPEMPIVEIGPGLGTMTRVLAGRARKLWAVELDQGKLGILERELKELPVKLIHADALQLSLRDIWGEQKGFLVGNLPYYITSPLIMHFLEQSDYLYGMTIMVQKEVADRIAANPGRKSYGVLSIAVQMNAEVEKITEVSAGSFFPAPKVNSAVLRLTMRKYPDLKVNIALFFKIVKAAFSQRRKTLGNSLSAGLKWPKEKVAELLKEAGISEQRRAETLSIEEYAKIVQAIEKNP